MMEHGVVALIVLAIFVSVYRRGTPEVVVAGVVCGVLLLLLAAPAG